MPQRSLAALLGLAVALSAGLDASAQSQRGLDARSQAVIDHWTPAARAAAIPRDLVIDERGLGYLRLPDGSFVPYGHDVAAATPVPMADTAGPTVTGFNPAAGATIGASATFSANVTDLSGVKSVSFKVQKNGGLAQSFTPTASGSVYSITLNGFTDGAWSWSVVAKDGAKPSNTTTTTPIAFTVSTSSGGGGGGGGGTGGDTVTNAVWSDNAAPVNTASGRIYFEMPSNKRWTRWSGYVCSGTVVTDGTTGRSMILTAAHCVYDDTNKAFARNVMFMPDQDETTSGKTDLNCSNDPYGCWVPNFGVVDTNWTTRTFPDNVHWDYAFYAVSDSGAHQQGFNSTVGEILDGAVSTLAIDFSQQSLVKTWAIGYSYSDDPNLMYCTDPLTSLNGDNYFLPNCGLTGGSSGGPWMQSAGSGPIMSLNSWGYTNQPGMAGPKFSNNSTQCVMNLATSSSFGTFTDGNAGYKASCP